jgi:hypothetical protein
VVDIKMVTFRWIAHKYLPFINDDQTWTPEAKKVVVRRDHNVFVSVHKCYRATKIGKKFIDGDVVE